MELTGERLIPAPIATVWAGLNDPAVLKDCIAGCDSLERTADDQFTALVAVRVGPVAARFRGQLKLADVQAPTRYTINFDGQGGVAGFGKGSADVALEAIGPTSTKLAYTARAHVGGKMAQIGSRLVDAAASKLTEDFFQAFEARVAAPHAATAADTVPASAGGPPAAAAGGVPRWGWIAAATVLAAAAAWWLGR